MTCCDGARSNDGLSFVLEMVCFFLLRPNFIVCKYIVENGFLSDKLFPSSKCFLCLNDIPTKSLEFISIVISVTDRGSRPAGIRGEPTFGAESFL